MQMDTTRNQEQTRLLLVEDDNLVAETIAVMVEDHFDVSLATSVAETTALLAAWDAPYPAVILLDCLLPGGNIRTLLAEADAKAIPVVLISGDPRESARIDPNRPFLAKPFQRTDLLRLLGEFA